MCMYADMMICALHASMHYTGQGIIMIREVANLFAWGEGQLGEVASVCMLAVLCYDQ